MHRIPLILLFLVACATGPAWHKEGATKEATEADLYLCRTQAPIDPHVQGPEQRFVAECMRAKGYSG